MKSCFPHAASLLQDFFRVFVGSIFWCCFQHASWAAFWTQFFQFFKLTSSFDIFLDASWDHFGRLLDQFWELFGNMFGKSFWHRFLMLFRCLPNLEIWFSSQRKRKFYIFVRVDVGIDFGLQNLLKSTPKLWKFEPQGLFWSPLATLWVVLGRLGALFEVSGAIWWRFMAKLQVGSKLRPRWAMIAPRWPCWAHFGSFLGGPGSILGHFCRDLWKNGQSVKTTNTLSL